MIAWILVAALALVYLLTPYVGRYLLKRGIHGIDVNKRHMPTIPEQGGVVLLLVFAVLYLGLIYQFARYEMLVIYAAVLLVALFGFLDHFFHFGAKAKLLVPFLVMFALIMYAPLPPKVFMFGLGISVILAAAGFSISTNLANMLAGFNGIETGLGMLSSFGMGAYLFLKGQHFAAFTCWLLFAELVGFWFHNMHPSKIFPGDSGTAMIGGVLGAVAVVTGEWLALMAVLVPHIFDAFLKLFSAGVLRKEKYKPVKLEGEFLTLPEETYHSLCRLLIGRKKMKETELVEAVMIIGAVCAGVLVLAGWLI